MRNKIEGIVLMMMALIIVPGALAAPPERTTMLDIALAANSEGQYAGSFDTLLAAATNAYPSILQILDNRGQRTLFAPTDEAFAKLGLNESNIDTLPTDVLTDILKYHFVNGARDSESVLESDRLRTINKQFIMQDGGVLNDEANIIVTDIKADNGIIHVIDAVLMPQ